MIEPFHDRDGITIYHGEAETILPRLEPVDLLLTDPPYGIRVMRADNTTRSVLAKSRDYGIDSWDDEPPPRWLLEQAIAKASKAMIFGGNHLDLEPSPCWFVWDKDNGGNSFADCELIWTNLEIAVRRFRWRWAGMIQERSGDKKEARVHPTQKPVPLLQWMLGFVPQAETVLDPFMGSGSTLVAAKLEGRRAIGIERRLDYCEAAVDRLSQGVLF